jgi:hypothetical protein
MLRGLQLQLARPFSDLATPLTRFQAARSLLSIPMWELPRPMRLSVLMVRQISPHQLLTLCSLATGFQLMQLQTQMVS